MPPLDHAELTLEADVDGDGVEETGTFVLAGGLQVNPSVRTGFLLDGAGSTINSLIGQYVLDSDTAEDLSQRRGFYVDGGGGAHVISVEARSWEGAVYDDSGEPAQWGNSDTVERTQASATGQPPQTQMDVLFRYLTTGTFDSRSPARFEYGEYSTPGLYDPLDVVLEEPQVQRSAKDGAWIDVSMTLITAASFENAIDAFQNDSR